MGLPLKMFDTRDEGRYSKEDSGKYKDIFNERSWENPERLESKSRRNGKCKSRKNGISTQN